MLKLGRKGVFAIWLTALVGIFIVMMFYLIFNQVIYASNGLYEIVNGSFDGATSNLTRPLAAMTTINNMWNYWPIAAIVGILLWAFGASIQKQTQGG